VPAFLIFVSGTKEPIADSVSPLLQEILNEPAASLLVICNLILIESLLSVDNAAVLAIMVLKLPEHQRSKALKYGIIGAYIFRGICLLLASYLVKIWWLKGLGGLYLLYLAIHWWISKLKDNTDRPPAGKTENRFLKNTFGRIGVFWATVISVEIMDLAFSLDNVFAAVAFSENILIILAGVFIGILAMRFVAQFFVKLMEKYPFLEACAFTIIGLLGVKLTLSFFEHFYPQSTLTHALESEATDLITSAVTICIFVVPILTSFLFNIPQRKDS
jgi:YkoY family integral membrane protein